MIPLDLKVIDYSFARFKGSTLKSAGIDIAIRYLPTSSGKDLTTAEVTDLHGNGVSLAVVFETTTGRSSAGFFAGVADAQRANKAAESLGWPSERPIYYADDQGTPWSNVAPYFEGVASVIARPWGIYGPYDVIEGARSKTKWLWQCAGYSGRGQGTGGSVMDGTNEVRTDGRGRRLSSAAMMYQCFGGALLGSTDRNLAFVADVGQWPHTGVTTVEDDMPKTVLVVDSQHYVWSLTPCALQLGRAHVPGPDDLAHILGLDKFTGGAWLATDEILSWPDARIAAYLDVAPQDVKVAISPEDRVAIAQQVADLAKLTPAEIQQLVEAFGTALTNG